MQRGSPLISRAMYHALERELRYYRSYLPKQPHEVLVVGVSMRDYIDTQSWHVTNRFDDWIVHVWMDEDGALQQYWCPGTLEPGAQAVAAGQTGKYGSTPVAKDGAGCFVDGVHEKVWYLHLHHWKYAALCQCKHTVIVRNQNEPSHADHAVFKPGPEIENQSFSFNCHRSTAGRRREGLTTDEVFRLVYERHVGNWSHGCAVHLFEDDLEHLVHLVKQADKHHGEDWYSGREKKEVTGKYRVTYIIIDGKNLQEKATHRQRRNAKALASREHHGFLNVLLGVEKELSGTELAYRCEPVADRKFGDIAFYGKSNDLEAMLVLDFNTVLGYDQERGVFEISINHRPDLLVVGRLR